MVCHGGGRAPAGAARGEALAQGVHAAPINRVVGGGPQRGFVQVEFAQQNGPGVAQTLGHRGRGLRPALRKGCRACGAGHARHIDVVFQAHHHAIERPARCARSPALGTGLGLLQSRIRVHMHKGMQLRVALRNQRQVRPGHADRVGQAPGIGLLQLGRSQQVLGLMAVRAGVQVRAGLG